MSRAIDELIGDWLATKGERRSGTVKLKDKELKFWWSAWTLDQQDYVYHDHVQGESFRPERLARVVVRKALKEDGERMFSDADKMDLMHRVDPMTIKLMALTIIADLPGRKAGDDPKAAAATDEAVLTTST